MVGICKTKLNEVSILARAENEGPDRFTQEFEENQKAIESRKISSRIHDDNIKKRVSSLTFNDTKRDSGFKERIKAQKRSFIFTLIANNNY